MEIEERVACIKGNVHLCEREIEHKAGWDLEVYMRRKPNNAQFSGKKGSKHRKESLRNVIGTTKSNKINIIQHILYQSEEKEKLIFLFIR